MTEMPLHLLPQDVAAPAELAADELSGKDIHDEPRHHEMPAVEEGPGTVIVTAAPHIADLPIPIIALVIGEPQPQPRGIREVDPGNASGIFRRVVYAIGREGEEPVGVMSVPPAPAHFRGATLVGRIGLVELCRHELEDVVRQFPLKDGVRSINVGKKNVFAFLNPRRREIGYRENRNERDRGSGEPPLPVEANVTDDHQQNGGGEQRVPCQVIDGQAEHGNGQHDCAELGGAGKQPSLFFAGH